MARSMTRSITARALRLLVVTGMLGLPVLGSATPAQAATTIVINDGGDGHLNAAEIAAGVSANGTADPLWDLTVKFDDANDSSTPPVTVATTARADGTWSIPRQDLSRLKDGYIVATAQQVALVHASATPVGGGPRVVVDAQPPASPESRTASIKDTSIPFVTDLMVEHAEDGYLNALEIQEGSAVSGKSEPGANLNLTVKKIGTTTPVISRSLVVPADGKFATDVLDLSTLPDGKLRVRATAVDEADNTSVSILDVTKDVVAPGRPILSFLDPNSDGRLDASEIHDVTVQGTTGPLNKIHLVVDDSDPATIGRVLDTTADAEGAWKVEHLELSNLQNGVISAVAFATDPAGNVGLPRTATILKDAVIPLLRPGVEILDNPPDHLNDDPNGLIDGFVDEEAGLADTANGSALRVRVNLDNSTPDPLELLEVRVTIDDSDPATPPITSAPKVIARSSTADTRTFSFDLTNPDGDFLLHDGIMRAEAQVKRTTPEGYAVVQGSDTSTLDLHAPVTTLGSVSNAVYVSFSNYYTNSSFSGSSKDLPPTTIIQFVVLKGRGSGGETFIRTAKLKDFNSTETAWTLSGVAMGLTPGTWTISAQAQDHAGNLEPIRTGTNSNQITVTVI